MYILIDSKTRAPVPLPFHTESADGFPITLKDCTDPGVLKSAPKGLVWWFEKPDIWHFRPPQAFGMELITEADFIAERE